MFYTVGNPMHGTSIIKQSGYFLFAFLTILFVLGHRRPFAVAQGTVTIISDGTFNDEDWLIFKVVSVAGTSHTVEQSLTGGNPDAFRSMTHTLPPVPPDVLAEIEVTHLYLGGSYDPGLQGAIDHLDYAEDGIQLALPWPDAHSITRLALVQGNRLFLSNDFIGFIGNTTWQSDALTNLTASDFAADDESGDQPDFSAAGGVIQFGYTRSNTRTETLPPVPPNEDLVYEHGIDNWSVTIFAEGAPPSNNPPVAVNDLAVVVVGVTSSIPVLENDSDPDGDILSISDYTLPLHGQLIPAGSDFGYTHSGGGSAVDSFTYTVTDGDLEDEGDVLILVDCGCAISCLYKKASTAPEDASFIHSFLSRLTNYLSSRLDALQGDMIDLPLIYRLRDRVMKPTYHGNRYVDMYYNTTPELLKILLVDSPALRDEAVAGVELWQENLRSLVDEDGSAIVTQEQVDAITSFLDNLSVVASPDLQGIIEDERARLGPPQEYVGLTIQEAKTKAIGDPVTYLPLVKRP